MSYNGYNYSPYYQQQAPVARSNTHGPSDQGSDANVQYYRSLADVPAQRTHGGPTQYNTNTSSENYDSGYNYQGYRPSSGVGNNTQEVSRSGAQPSTTYYDSTSRSYMDTSALGNLAYASALGRDGSSGTNNISAQHRVSENTGTSTPLYVPSVPPLRDYQARSDSRGSGTAKTPTTQNYPVSPYVTTIAEKALAQSQNPTRLASPLSQYRSDQSSSQSKHTTGQTAGNTSRGAEHNFTSSTHQSPSIAAPIPIQPSRSHEIQFHEPPTSGVPPYKTSMQPGHAGVRSGFNSGSQHGGTPSHQATSSHGRATPAESPVISGHNRPGGQSHNRSGSSTSVSSGYPVQISRQNDSREGYSNKGHAKAQSAVSVTSAVPSASEQYPITVDPNQVFNVAEYQRRKLEAEAEVSRRAADQQKAMSTERITHTNSTPAPQVGTSFESQSKQPSVSNGSKEQIETEIKAMIEKMREYKAKDPAVFSEVWERFKQVQPPPRASSQIPQTSKEPQSATFPPARDTGIALPGFMDTGPLLSPSPILTQQTTMPESASNQLPDLGKFPFLRRRRMKADKGKQKGSSLDNAINADDYNSSDFEKSAIDPGLSANKVSKVANQERPAVASYAYREETLRKVMQTFSGTDPVAEGSSSTPHASHYGGEGLKATGTGTVWPESTKSSLAIVAKNALESSAANTGKTISIDKFHALLDTNPSYDQLCWMLHRLGFSFEKAEFARLLLDAVPTDSTTPLKTPRPASKPKRTPANDSPRRPRGRPRKDGLPPQQQQNIRTPNTSTATSLVAPTPRAPEANPYAPAYQGSASQGVRPIAAGEDHGDQNMASALKSAITQIDDQTFKQNPNVLTPQPAANTSYSLYGPTSNSGAVSDYTARNAGIRGVLKWSTPQNLVAESFQNKKEKQAQTGRTGHKIAEPSSLVNNIHPRFNDVSLAGQYVDVSQVQQNGGVSSASVSIPPAGTQPTPLNLTKEQMARKRTFSEIVDLTQDLDDEEAERQKRVRLAQIHGGGGSSWVNDAQIDTLNLGNGLLHSSMFKAMQSPIDNPTPASSGKQDLSQFRHVSAGLIADREVLRSANLVKELNKNDARKNSTYNIKTLARDILISKGIHPTEKPLNWHLNGLRNNFRSVTANSDLSTFRWDLVDPGGPKIHRATESETKAQDADDEAGKRTKTHTSVPTHTSIPIHTSTPTHTSPPTRGRPRGRPPRYSLDRGVFRDSNAGPSNAKSLDKFRDEVSGLVRNSRGGRGSRSRGTTHLQPSTTHQSLQSTKNAIDIVGSFPISPMSSELLDGDMVTSTKLASSSKKPSTGEGTKISSPSGFDASADSLKALTTGTPSTYSLSVRIPPSPLQQVVKTAAPRGRPPGSVNRSSISETTTPDRSAPKARGRPRGSTRGTPSRGRASNRGGQTSYRTKVPPDGIGVLLPSRSPSTSSRLSHIESTPDAEKRRKGRPSRQATVPRFQVFRCQWEGCHAELHNLATLRKHVFKLHGKETDTEGEAKFEVVNTKVPCLWFGCEQEGVFSSTTGVLKFADRDSWKMHVEKRHLETVAWELGDGPSTTPSDVEPSSYLSDSQGRQVTPLARTEGPPDPLPPGSGRSPTRAYHKAHGNVTEHQKSQAELNSQVATKQVAGVFVARDTDKPTEPQKEVGSDNEKAGSDESSE